MFGLRFCMICLFLNVSFSNAQHIKEYKTEDGESLRDVAKKLDVNYRALLKANPKLSRWPKENTVVKIPDYLYELKYRRKRSKDPLKDRKSDLVKPTQDSLQIHIVKPKETIYGLSRQYGISMIDLINKNKVLSVEGLIIGQELNIPYQKKLGQETPSDSHIVQTKETWYSLSKLYGVTIENLKATNLEVSLGGLKIGSTIEIPKNKKISLKSPEENTHVIAKGETLYSVSRFYGINVDELLAVNDTVVVDSLMIGTVLSLPKKVIESVTVSTVMPVYKSAPVFYDFKSDVDSLDVILKEYKVSKDSIRSLNPSIDSLMTNGGKILMGFKKSHQLFGNRQWFKDSIIIDKPISAMIMLPFDLKKNDTLSKEILFANNSSLPSIVSDFYMGAEIAIDSLKKQGVQLNINVFDTEKSIDSINKNITKLKTSKPDVIIGPLYSSNAIYVATQFPKIPVYYPIYSKKQSSFLNDNIIKTASDKALFKREILAFVKENRKGEHLLIVGLEKNNLRLENLKRQLCKKDTLGNPFVNDVSLITLSNGYIAKEAFLEKIKLDKPNWILIADNNNVAVSDVFNNVLNLPKENQNTTPIRILSFEKSSYIQKLPYEVLCRYHYTYATDKVEYRQLMNKDFEQSYLRKNYQYPSHHAERGFDVTYDAILRVLKSKNGGKDVFAPSHRVKTAFIYKKAEKPVQVNQAVFVNTVEDRKGEGFKIIRLR